MTDSTFFNKLFRQWSWKPIRNCPGRFILTGRAVRTSAVAMAGTGLSAYKFSSRHAPDKITVVKFSDGSGGLISFGKEHDRFLHTLGDSDGFERKLRQLEIACPKTSQLL